MGSPTHGAHEGRTTALVLASATLGALLVGVVDYATGIEVRLYPLYYLPISAGSWRGGPRWAVALALLSTTAWVIANRFIGPQAHAPWIVVINVIMQLGSFVLVGALIASLRAAYRREFDHSREDALTGLANSRGFYDEANRLLELARRYRHALTFAYIDLDNFKQVNDTLGHAGGDRVLRVAADVLARGVRRVDLVARLGGDEFALLMPETDGEGAASVLQRLHAQLVKELRRHCPVTSASVGAVVFSRPPAELDALIQQADAVMYAVKRDGKCRLRIESAAPDELEVSSSSVATPEPENSYTAWIARRR